MTIENLLLLKAYLIAGWLLALFVAERLRPTTTLTQWPTNRAAIYRLLRNGTLWLINIAISPLIVLPVTLWATQYSLGWRPEWWQGNIGLLLDLVLLDCWIYWWHRANHRLPFLWRFHRVHHLDQRLDSTSSIRFHAGEVVLSALVRAVVIVALDIPFTSVLVFELLIMLAAIFQHSDIRLSATVERYLSKVIVTPGIHWVHHHAVRRDTDSNYATILSGWDRWFGSRSATQRVATLPIGVHSEVELPLWQLLIAPFRSQPSNVSAAVRESRAGEANND